MFTISLSYCNWLRANSNSIFHNCSQLITGYWMASNFMKKDSKMNWNFGTFYPPPFHYLPFVDTLIYFPRFAETTIYTQPLSITLSLLLKEYRPTVQATWSHLLHPSTAQANPTCTRRLFRRISSPKSMASLKSPQRSNIQKWLPELRERYFCQKFVF